MKNIILCPCCNTEIDVEQAIKENVEKNLTAEFLKRKSTLEEEFKSKQSEFERKEKVLADEKERQDRIISEKLKEAETVLKSKIQNELQQKNDVLIENLRKESHEKSEAIKSMQKRELDLLKQQQQIEEQKEALTLEVQRTLANERKLIEEKARAQEREANFLKSQEKEHLIASLKQELENMHRKVEQGSMQSQGEVMEIELEKLLKQSFPFDEVTEVPKGTNGADVLHKVRNHQMADCGTIVFESKRTKSFSQSWADKLKSDMRSHKAQIPVLVTEVLPKEMTQFGLKDGVWICTFGEAVALVTVLRQSLLSLHDQKVADENKGEKQQLLYKYLTSPEFAQHIEFVLSGFNAMKETLDKEKKVTLKLWKEREKQIEMMTNNTIDIYGSIKGIAGSSVVEIDSLGLDQLLLEE